MRGEQPGCREADAAAAACHQRHWVHARGATEPTGTGWQRRRLGAIDDAPCCHAATFVSGSDYTLHPRSLVLERGVPLPGCRPAGADACVRPCVSRWCGWPGARAPSILFMGPNCRGVSAARRCTPRYAVHGTTQWVLAVTVASNELRPTGDGLCGHAGGPGLSPHARVGRSFQRTPRCCAYTNWRAPGAVDGGGDPHADSHTGSLQAAVPAANQGACAALLSPLSHPFSHTQLILARVARQVDFPAPTSISHIEFRNYYAATIAVPLPSMSL